jgi:hypothetical protein
MILLHNHESLVFGLYIVTDPIIALPGNSSVNAVQGATIEEAAFSAIPTIMPIDCLDSDYVICI